MIASDAPACPGEFHARSLVKKGTNDAEAPGSGEFHARRLVKKSTNDAGCPRLARGSFTLAV